VSDLEKLKALGASLFEGFLDSGKRHLGEVNPQVEAFLKEQADYGKDALVELGKAKLAGNAARVAVKKEALLAIETTAELRLRSIAGDVAEERRHAFRSALGEFLRGVSAVAGLEIPIPGISG